MDATTTLLALYDGATDDQRDRGRRWYPTARRVLARDARQYGTTTARAVAVFAITSPDTQLLTNLRWTRQALASRGAAKVGRYPGRMVPAVRNALASRRPGKYATGPKVAPFYRAILGDTDALVLDRWALRVATGDDRPTAQNRRTADAAYREAAALRGESPRDFQAITWIAARESAMKKRNGSATAVRYTDIHDVV